MIYDNLRKNTNNIVEIKNKVLYNFIDGAFVEIVGNKSANYLIKFVNNDTEEVLYETRIKTNHWCRTAVKYFINWRIEIYENDQTLSSKIYNATDKRVYISFESASLGDTIAWIPYALEFKKKHNCHVIVSTFKNFLFESVYPELEFVNPGTVVNDLYAMYKIGWFYDGNKEPIIPNTVPLQQTATNILGLKYKEIKPKITFIPKDNIHGKYVAIATNSTAQCKFWTKEGWQEVINYLVDNGYKVINVSKERNDFKNCYQLPDGSLQEVNNVIHHAKFFIGLSSGLSWMAWALGKQVMMISNFSDEHHEFSCIRITNTDVCHGCWNDPNEKFDKGNWNWCPRNKNFECHTSITGKMVIDVISNHI